MIPTGSVWCQCFPSGIPLWPQWCTELTPCFYFILFSCDKSTTVDWWSWKCTFSFLFILVLLNQCLFNSCYSLCAFCLASQLNKAKWRTCGAEVKMELGCMLVMMGDSFLWWVRQVKISIRATMGDNPPKWCHQPLRYFTVANLTAITQPVSPLTLPHSQDSALRQSVASRITLLDLYL